MMSNKKIGLIIDKDFATKHIPPYPHPIFLSYETPMRIESILTYLNKKKILEHDNVTVIEPIVIDDSILELAHSKYYIDSVKYLSKLGSGLIGEEVFITADTYGLAKKAVGGAIIAMEKVINKEINQSFALIRPPGHHALREIGSGLCIFNNIANAVLYLREKLQFHKKIAIIDIDDHFGDGLVQYFYEDPSVLYFSVHEYDFVEGDIGFIHELGDGEGIGKSINFPLPMKSTDENFLEFMDILEPILKEFSPDLIIVAVGFDMHFDDPIGNNLMTSISYYKFTQKILKLADEICEGKLVFVLEGGYSLIALPFCVHAVIKALLNEEYKQPLCEKIEPSSEVNHQDVKKIRSTLLKLLSNYWNL
ncbi:hypothetical protein LCGC14_1685530 [marine sediment metagenome]|uniref:Histone deacetylase domain-containing protein n=1 Tax=marine sediment metagenome TaxID=412755 RepID=A0A0F9KME0_9ZZZZ|nr:histone deacetylase [archaeon]